MIKLNKRETATVLAALRYFQRQPRNVVRGSLIQLHFDDVEPLSDEQIDSLCERINTDHEPKVLKKPLGKRAKRLLNKDGYLTVIVPLDFDELLGAGVEGLDDILDGLILGDDVSGFLSDISWKVVGAKKGALLLEVTACPEGTDFDE